MQNSQTSDLIIRHAFVPRSIFFFYPLKTRYPTGPCTLVGRSELSIFNSELRVCVQCDLNDTACVIPQQDMRYGFSACENHFVHIACEISYPECVSGSKSATICDRVNALGNI